MKNYVIIFMFLLILGLSAIVVHLAFENLMLNYEIDRLNFVIDLWELNEKYED